MFPWAPQCSGEHLTIHFVFCSISWLSNDSWNRVRLKGIKSERQRAIVDDSQLTRERLSSERDWDEEKGKAREEILKNAFVHTMKVNAIQNNTGAHWSPLTSIEWIKTQRHYSKYLLMKKEFKKVSYSFKKMLGWVIDDRIFLLGEKFTQCKKLYGSRGAVQMQTLEYIISFVA